MKWTFITAAFGAENFRQSAERLIDQAKSLSVFDEYVYVNEENLKTYAPSVSTLYKEYLNSNTTGYGYFSWKSEIVNSVMNSNRNNGIVYIDAGCEINSNWIASLRLRSMLKRSENDCFFHTLEYPEAMYSKNIVMDYYKLSQEQRLSPQVQATWFFLSGQLGREIAQNWFEGCTKGIEMLDDSGDGDSELYVANRYDQSVLSCVVKNLGIVPRKHKPCFRPITLGSKIRCSVHPIWSSRNRSGESIQRKWKRAELEEK